MTPVVIGLCVGLCAVNGGGVNAYSSKTFNATDFKFKINAHVFKRHFILYPLILFRKGTWPNHVTPEITWQRYALPRASSIV